MRCYPNTKGHFRRAISDMSVLTHKRPVKWNMRLERVTDWVLENSVIFRLTLKYASSHKFRNEGTLN